MPPKPPKTKPTSKKPAPPKPPTKAKPSASTHTPKAFSIQPWTGEGEGEKIIAYGPSGIGKTSLAALAPTPVFLGLDDGGRKIVHPETGESLMNVPGIETFQDVRDVLHQVDLFDGFETVVVDTVTKLEPMMQQHAVDYIPTNNGKVNSFRKFGWDGDRHVADLYRLLMSDLDALARRGKNIVLLAQQGQIKVANAEGADYVADGPALQHRSDVSAAEELKQWADHVFRIGYLSVDVQVDSKKKVGKVVSDDTSRAIFTSGAQHFAAKTRPIRGRRLPGIISFESEADDSLWAYVFGDALDEQEA